LIERCEHGLRATDAWIKSVEIYSIDARWTPQCQIGTRSAMDHRRNPQCQTGTKSVSNCHHQSAILSPVECHIGTTL